MFLQAGKGSRKPCFWSLCLQLFYFARNHRTIQRTYLKHCAIMVVRYFRSYSKIVGNIIFSYYIIILQYAMCYPFSFVADWMMKQLLYERNHCQVVCIDKKIKRKSATEGCYFKKYIQLCCNFHILKRH